MGGTEVQTRVAPLANGNFGGSGLQPQNGRDWQRFHAAVAVLARHSADEREARLRQLAD